MYLDPGSLGANQFHVIVTGPPAAVATVFPTVTAGVAGSAPQFLRQIKVSAGHFSEVVYLTPGTWTFHVRTPYGRSSVSFGFTRTLP
jgi:hypothetical protein